MFPRTTVFLLLAATYHMKVASAGNHTSIYDAFPELRWLQQHPLSNASHGPGDRNATACCLLAVKSSFVIENGTGSLNWSETNYIQKDLSIADFQGSQFPCGAKYTGNNTGAPKVIVQYDWCNKNCGGWTKSSNDNLQQWIAPLVGFILPSLVFCLNIPRRRKLLVGDRWFKARPGRTIGFFGAPFQATGAALLVGLDTLIWLGVCFAAAGPMIVSGVYEAFLDNEILSVLKASLRTGSLTTEMRARLLLVVLVGNFDIDGDNEFEATGTLTTKEHDENSISFRKFIAFIKILDFTKFTRHSKENHVDNHKEQSNRELTTWRDMEGIISGVKESFVVQANLDQINHLEPQADEDITKAEKNFGIRETDSGSHDRNPQERDEDIAVARMARDNQISRIKIEPDAAKERALEDLERKRISAIDAVKTRLRTMLAAQFSFGSTIGAPVVFFAGSFIYTLVDTLTKLGDNDTSHALAFGMWWMIMPHVAIVSGLLLGANNPNTLEGIIGKETPPKIEKSFLGIFELAYPSRYKTQWMWFRGRSKRQWLDQVLAMENIQGNDLSRLRRKTAFTLSIWLSITGLSIFLIVVPCLLAFLTSYYTPRIGVSCRTFAFSLYAVFQVCQILLWVWVLTNSETDTHGALHSPTHLATSSWTSRAGSIRGPSLFSTISYVSWWSLILLFGIGSIFISIGGTLMQIMGVYRNCLCAIPLIYWRQLNGPEAWLNMGSNSAESIKNANTYWRGLGISSLVLLCVASYVGWWYQRRLRYSFRHIAEQLEGETR